MSARGAFIPETDIALFLDVDGTLLEIAATPDAVKVPAALRNTLSLAAQRAGGALALISGRSLHELDRLFAPCMFPAAGQHGLEMRDSSGNITRPKFYIEALDPARALLMRMQSEHAGLLLEDKGSALAMHFRQVPHLEAGVQVIMEEQAERLGDSFMLRTGKCVLELAPRGFSKRDAIETFMRQSPFAGRAPVFVGDDVTDEDGFEAVNAMGGYSIRVGGMESTAARYRYGSVSAVVAWLRDRNLNRHLTRARD